MCRVLIDEASLSDLRNQFGLVLLMRQLTLILFNYLAMHVLPLAFLHVKPLLPWLTSLINNRDKTTYVHASTISFHIFICELHILSRSRLCRQLQKHIGFQIDTLPKYTSNWLLHDLDYIGFTEIRCQHRPLSFGVWRVHASKFYKSNASICSITSWTGYLGFSDVALS